MEKIEIQKIIGEKIIETRLSLGVSQSELARLCGKDRQTIEKLEKGKVNPTIFTLFEIAQALSIKVSTLTDFQE